MEMTYKGWLNRARLQPQEAKAGESWLLSWPVLHNKAFRTPGGISLLQSCPLFMEDVNLALQLAASSALKILMAGACEQNQQVQGLKSPLV